MTTCEKIPRGYCGLTSMSIVGTAGITHVHKSIQQLRNLHTLDLRNNLISDVNFLGKLPHLREIDLRGNPISEKLSFTTLVQHLTAFCPGLKCINGRNIHPPLTPPKNTQLQNRDTAPESADRTLQTSHHPSLQLNHRLEAWQQKVFELLVTLRLQERSWIKAQDEWKRERRELLSRLQHRLVDTSANDFRHFQWYLDTASTLSTMITTIEQNMQRVQFKLKKKVERLCSRLSCAILRLESGATENYRKICQLCRSFESETDNTIPSQIVLIDESSRKSRHSLEEKVKHDQKLIDSLNNSQLREFCKDLVKTKYSLMEELENSCQRSSSKYQHEIQELQSKVDVLQQHLHEEQELRHRMEQSLETIQRQTLKEHTAVIQKLVQAEEKVSNYHDQITNRLFKTDTSMSNFERLIRNVKRKNEQLKTENTKLLQKVKELQQKQTNIENSKIEALHKSLETAKKRIADLEHERHILLRQCNRH